VYPALKRPKGDPHTVEDEALTQPRERYELVVDLRELPHPRDGRLTEREIRVGGGHDANCASALSPAQSGRHAVSRAP
jgi:hypothetical protein